MSDKALRNQIVSADTPALLVEAQQLVADQLVRLRTLVADAQQHSESLTARQRQIERALDEAIVQHRFAFLHQQANTAALGTRETELRTQRDTLQREAEANQHALKQLDQLIRQIEMSSTVLLGGSSEGTASDPWMLALRAQVIHGREEERTRLAREVHDGPAQVLANSLMGLEQCISLFQQHNAERLGIMLDRMRGVTREGLHEVRQFIADLRPGQLEEQGLAAASQDYIRRYQKTYNASVTVDIDPLPHVPTEVAIVFYRIVQEALQNAHKHARGTPVHVAMKVHNERLLLAIQDHGPGFDPHEVARRAGRVSWGLTSMRERAELIGARLTVTARPNQGTLIAVVLPLR